MSSNVGDVVLKLGVKRDFNELVQMWGLILSNPMVCLKCFVVKKFVMVAGFTLNCFNGKDLGMVMRVY